jgi:hypothetical protein
MGLGPRRRWFPIAGSSGSRARSLLVPASRVCLGKELTVDPWLDDWNKLRRRGNTPNKIGVIELRTDPKYGKFLIKSPASADVSIIRRASNAGDIAEIRINDFVSPSILDRLKDQSGVLAPRVSDWRSMVDSVMVDTDFDGRVFNIAAADIPEEKHDLVAGRYEIAIPSRPVEVALKITDMLGEEVVIRKAL